VLLGKGWYNLPQDAFTAVLGYKTVGHRSLRVLCHVHLENNATLRFRSGDSGNLPFVHGADELVTDHLFLGETIDKRRATPGWRLDASGYIALIDWVHGYYGDKEVLAQHYDGTSAYMGTLLEYVNTSASGSSLLDLSYPSTRYGDWSTHRCKPSARPTRARTASRCWLSKLFARRSLQ